MGDTDRKSIAALLWINRSEQWCCDVARQSIFGLLSRHILDPVAVRTSDHSSRFEHGNFGESVGLPGPGAGLSLSFVTIGLFVATVGYSIGLDADLFVTSLLR